MHAISDDPAAHARDVCRVEITDERGKVIEILGTLSNLNRENRYVLKTYDVTEFLGRRVHLVISVVEDDAGQTSFLIDDVSLAVLELLR